MVDHRLVDADRDLRPQVVAEEELTSRCVTVVRVGAGRRGANAVLATMRSIFCLRLAESARVYTSAADTTTRSR